MSDIDGNSPEGDRRDAETNRIAAEGNRISAEDARVISDQVRASGDSERSARRKKISVAQIGAYLLIVVIAVFGFYQIEQTQTDLCNNTKDNRQATRNVVVAIDRLANDLVMDGKTKEEMTAEDRASIILIEAFKVEQLALLNDQVCN